MQHSNDEMEVVKAEIVGKDIFFAVKHQDDYIQRKHKSKNFYEFEELKFMSQFIPEEATILDIGANVGNHTIYFGKFLKPKKIIVFEPNPMVIDVLKKNIGLNELDSIVETKHLGIGLSRDAENGFGLATVARNLGGARLKRNTGGIAVAAGDQLVNDEHIDFMKIDVELMEMEVLFGLSKTIDRCRPKIFVEVDMNNQSAFDEWLNAKSYTISEEFKNSRRNTNYLCIPD